MNPDFAIAKFGMNRNAISRLIVIKTVSLVFFFSILCAVYAAEDSKKIEPFIGIVSGDRVNVRACDNTASEVICQLAKSEEVSVVGEKGGWYRVALPQKAPLYIYKTNISEKDGQGVILEDKANVRTAATSSSSIVGRLNKGDSVKILNRYLDWYEVQAPENTFGWVRSDYLEKKKAFMFEEGSVKLNDISSLRPGEEPILTGMIDNVGKISERLSPYKLTKDGEFAGYLISEKIDLNKYVHLETRIWGVKKEVKSTPLIEVDAIEVVQ